MVSVVKVKLFGVARLKTGVSGFEADVSTVEALRSTVPGMTKREAKDLVVLVNGKTVGRGYRFKDGDEVSMFSPAGGG